MQRLRVIADDSFRGDCDEISGHRIKSKFIQLRKAYELPREECIKEVLGRRESFNFLV
jgi:hypothetical protein